MKHFIVEGSKILKEAFIKQLQEEGFTPYSKGTINEIITDGSVINTVVNYPTQFQAGGRNPTYTLPQDWDKAIEAFRSNKKTLEVYKVGDIVLLSNSANGYGALTDINNQLVKISSISDEYIKFSWKGGTKSTRIAEIVRKATDEEIKSFNTRTISIKTEDGNKKVKIGEGYIRADGNVFSINSLEKLLVEMSGQNFGYLGGYKIVFPVVSIGCWKNIEYSEIKKIITTYYEVNGK